MLDHAVVDPREWRQARIALLEREKEFTRLRDELSVARRALPWEEVTKPYVFEGEHGLVTLGDLFAGRRQLLVQHVMFAPEWQAACKNCSFWMDGFDAMRVHIEQRDATFVAVSRAPLEKLLAFRARMGWSTPFVSSGGNDFNYDYHVSFAPGADGMAEYNYRQVRMRGTDMPGVSVFWREDDGRVFHTYSCFSRGIDTLNAAYQCIDLLPKGRDEAGLPNAMAWVKLHDLYES